MKIRLPYLGLAGAALGFAAAAFGQSTPPPNPPCRGHRPPPDLLLRALDTNKDGVLSAQEIANAPTSLRTLDQNADGKLTLEELRPPRPADAPPPPPDAAKHHPISPVMAALDTDHDGVLSAAEIANAAASLLTLDANHDGQLTPDELRPPPPEGAADDLPPPPAD